jgi:hypothetical protein
MVRVNIYSIEFFINNRIYIGIWSTAAERTSNRPTTSSSYGRTSQGISFVSGGVKSGSKIEKKKPPPTETKKKSIILESYDSDEDSDERINDEDDDDEVEIIEKKRKKRGDSSDDDGDDDSDIEEIQNESNRRHGSV